MQINKEGVDNLIREFRSTVNKNTIDKKNLTKFNKSNKEDLLYLSFIESESQHYITFLNFIIKRLKPTNIVELGNREGLSTVSIYDAIKKAGGDFYSIDIEKDLRYCPKHMFQDAQMHFLFGDVCSLAVLQKLPRKIDLLFTDTLHFDFQLRDEWEIYQHLLSDTALVAIDDININDKRKIFDEVPFAKWDLTELCHANGWGLFLFERKVGMSETTQKEELYKAIIRVWERKYESLFIQTSISDSKRFSVKIKNLLKKTTPVYKLYTYLYNNFNSKFRKRIVYSGSVRL